jgi:hypothetical protein
MYFRVGLGQFYKVHANLDTIFHKLRPWFPMVTPLPIPNLRLGTPLAELIHLSQSQALE